MLKAPPHGAVHSARSSLVLLFRFFYGYRDLKYSLTVNWKKGSRLDEILITYRRLIVC